jgi:hypothetical protein
VGGPRSRFARWCRAGSLGFAGGLGPVTERLLGSLLAKRRLVILVPAGEQDGARRQIFLFPLLLAFLQFEIEIERVFALPVMISSELIGPVCVFLDGVGELVEELAVNIYAGALHLGAGVADLVFVEQGCLFHAFEPKDYVLECLVEI